MSERTKKLMWQRWEAEDVYISAAIEKALKGEE